MLSTFVGVYDVVHCKDDRKSVPATVDTYNKHMGGIDKSYQILYTYLDETKSLLWAKKLVFNFLMGLIYTHILY